MARLYVFLKISYLCGRNRSCGILAAIRNCGILAAIRSFGIPAAIRSCGILAAKKTEE
jgi:hypothetical protein